ncbi:nuclear transport factor 2 family protein [Herbiconiux sp. A18JL235]|uniref:Nuclear transport factor 2 family protein n=1 Tax=Herbiconiux sp. A18JL235 TaxID=3152363 RepID=A0AB39BII2_9MICO
MSDIVPSDAHDPFPSGGPHASDRFAIEDLYAKYFWALDTQDIEIYLTTFWSDASLVETQLDGSIETWSGLDKVREFTESHFGGYRGHQHRDSNRLYQPIGPVSESGTPDRWSISSYYFTSHRDDQGHTEFFSTGYSRDIVERRSGVWRFAERGVARWNGDLTHPLRRDV